MSDPNYTHIILVVDASGSMSSRYEETINGVQAYLDDQMRQSGQTTVSLVTFDDMLKWQWTFNPISRCTDFRSLYRIGGMTALLDAMGSAITNTSAAIQKLSSWERPGKTIMVVVTDGHENSSCTYRDPLKISAMVRHHEDNENWDVLFMGADMNAITAGGGVGVRAGKSLSFSGNPANQREAWLAASAATTNARSGELDKDADFFGEQWRSKVR